MSFSEEQKATTTEVLTAFNKIPYALINAEVDGSARDTLSELTKICEYYRIYKKGAKFNVEGTNGDYVPAKLNYKMCASLINKEARFLYILSIFCLFRFIPPPVFMFNQFNCIQHLESVGIK